LFLITELVIQVVAQIFDMRLEEPANTVSSQMHCNPFFSIGIQKCSVLKTAQKLKTLLLWCHFSRHKLNQKKRFLR
jgi:hypothetical protein